MQLVRVEWAISGSGSNRKRFLHDHVVRSEELAVHELRPGAAVEVQQAFEVPPSAPASFGVWSAGIAREIRVHVGLRRWADRDTSIPLVVR